MHDLNDLYYFVQVVDLGGFAPAGRTLGEPKHNMVLQAMSEGFSDGLPLGVALRVQDRLETHAPDLTASPAAKAMEELRSGWRIPGGEGELLPWLLAMSQDDLVSLLALCVARTVDGVSGDEADDRTPLLADAIALNMGRGGSQRLKATSHTYPRR